MKIKQITQQGCKSNSGCDYIYYNNQKVSMALSIKQKSHSRSTIPKLERRIFTWSTKSEPVAYSVSIPTAKPNIAHLFDQHPRYRQIEEPRSKSM